MIKKKSINSNYNFFQILSRFVAQNSRNINSTYIVYTSVTYARRIVPPLHSSVRPRARARVRARRIRERKRECGRGGELVERVSEWLGGCLSDGGEDEGGRGEDRWTGKKNTVANQTENTFSLFLYLFRVNICSGNIRSFRYVSFRSISSSDRSVPFCSHPES